MYGKIKLKTIVYGVDCRYSLQNGGGAYEEI